MLGAVAVYAPGHYLAPLGDKRPQSLHVFVIHGIYVIGAEAADFAAMKGLFLAPAPAGAFVVRVGPGMIHGHYIFS
jgi:hypothetical protein